MDKPILQHVERADLSVVAAEQIKRAIEEGRFLPGDRLPSERKLSSEMGISRPVLRRGLQLLAEEGLLDIQRGRGNFVAEPSHLSSVDPLRWLRANKQMVHDFYEARLAIEPMCAALAAERATAADIKMLQQTVREADRLVAAGQIHAFIAIDIDFHAMVARIARNRFLYEMLDAIIRPETDLRNVLHRLPAHLAVAQERHRVIVGAIAARDPQAARQAMRAALEGPATDIEMHLDTIEEEE